MLPDGRVQPILGTCRNGVDISHDGNIVAFSTKNIDEIAKVFVWDGEMWVKRGTFPGALVVDYDSVSMSFDGNVVAIGSPSYNNWMGTVKVYEWDAQTTTWIQRGDDEVMMGRDEEVGYNVQLSADGNVVYADASGYNDWAGTGEHKFPHCHHHWQM